jgi:hypothetical protein
MAAEQANGLAQSRWPLFALRGVTGTGKGEASLGVGSVN